MNIGRLLYDQNWNIGFCEQTSEELIQSEALKPVRWMKHPFRDRWFADPFIYRVTESEIVVFVEECPIDNPKGIISELVIDRRTMCLKERYVMLELDTHLSYPAIFEYSGKVYVYPENGMSGCLNIYEYEGKSHKLINPVCILKEAVADASILKRDEKFIIVATKYPDTQEKAYFYESDSLFGPYISVSLDPFQELPSCSRPGGNWIIVSGGCFRPAQNCSARYGGSLKIMLQNFPEKKEEAVFEIHPQGYRYNLGLHTINFHNQLCVVDGCGYFYPTFARCVNAIRSFKHAIIR